MVEDAGERAAEERLDTAFVALDFVHGVEHVVVVEGVRGRLGRITAGGGLTLHTLSRRTPLRPLHLQPQLGHVQRIGHHTGDATSEH